MMLMAPWFVLVVVVIIVLIAAVWVTQGRDDTGDGDALQVLDRRLAEGDMTVEQHAQRRQVLQEHRHSSRPRSGRWGGPLAAIAATLLVGLLVWLVVTSWGGGGWMGGHMGWGGSTSSTSVPGHAQGGMQGTIVVTDAG